MKQFILVFLGGGFGSILRYIISKNLNAYYSNFYLGTFLVNVIGCLIIGILIGLSLKNNYISENQTLLLATGFCGGFTTFSTFALESNILLKESSLLQTSLYMGLSVVIGVLAISLGLWICKML
ncbi:MULTISPECIES: fluoride efflux transporter CrcB [Maribacter]|uniref:Fluoride-specific ion channel FluC n=1 Tax=Maribacter dokdonensis TaxID=320912 RepID=A0ABY0UMA1_9FLAO|nr:MULTISPECIES: fluoride efflux transporter CrcB [Maribacter]MBU2899757.1 fluoride efflux transporter CrcB [Maribacter dokdonensis]PHN93993.1 fluoride efflux transporter CrcB [Maribacter sp. 6B07]CAG2531413.1 CrcB protein [Maribacter dokdonensis]SDS90345.1 CrcB protein [Maribacter dokdonensis]|tara:strand:+ start:113 stop:484 length:372 start_codon:yes stop_codon:yes gene_type:complete